MPICHCAMCQTDPNPPCRFPHRCELDHELCGRHTEEHLEDCPDCEEIAEGEENAECILREWLDWR